MFGIRVFIFGFFVLFLIDSVCSERMVGGFRRKPSRDQQQSTKVSIWWSHFHAKAYHFLRFEFPSPKFHLTTGFQPSCMFSMHYYNLREGFLTESLVSPHLGPLTSLCSGISCWAHLKKSVTVKISWMIERRIVTTKWSYCYLWEKHHWFMIV